VAALAAGAQSPGSDVIASHDQRAIGEAFMRLNAARFQRVYFAGRCVVVLLSLATAWLVWRWARRRSGAPGALLALAFYALAPEALAHGGLVTLDVATGLGFLATLYAGWIFVRAGRWSAWAATALAAGFTVLTRFTGWLLIPMLAVLAVVAVFQRRVRRPRRVALVVALLVPATLVALQIGYLGRTSFRPLATRHFHSRALTDLERALPGLRLPLPDDYVAGLDWQSYEAQGATPPTFLFGR